MTLTDPQARQAALQPNKSFIVQAPAGSGKTELLTQRFLRLLAYAERAPEEVIAITFTQKAAFEMRERILSALQMAQNQPQPTIPHKKNTWVLAKEALLKDQQCNWNLLNNPKRIRVMTIDALCLSITQSAPLLSELGAQPTISEDQNTLYQEAVETFFKHANHHSTKNALHTLLLHVDNRIEYLIELLCLMLQKREQWLPHIINNSYHQDQLRQHLELSLQHIAQHALTTLQHAAPIDLMPTIIDLARHASSQLTANNNPQFAQLAALSSNTDYHYQQLDLWQTLARWLLTRNNQWRKSVTKNQGFPPGSNNKEAMQSLLLELQSHPKFRQALIGVQSCPPLRYNKEQWQLLNALITILPILVASLRVTMQRRGEIDFLEITLAALRALGDEDQPTDLALYLDYQIRHLLIDEFQDTSTIQFSFFESLISQWLPGDGRTVFLVGDPMQSVYRFRNAEVALFLRAQKSGIANLPLDFLQLQLNFRSTHTLVEWANDTFSKIMPQTADPSIGAVTYNNAIATNDQAGDIHFYSSTEPRAIAKQVASIINHIPPEQSSAILVRSRSQLGDIIHQLQQHDIPFSAIEIEPLVCLSEIIDLYHLSMAVLHFDDRIAWFSLLRAPFCGIGLEDLHKISQYNPRNTLLNTLIDPTIMSLISNDGQRRLQHFLQAMLPIIENLGRQPLSEQVKLIWHSLNAHLVHGTATAQKNCQHFFELLVKLESSGRASIQRKTLTDELNKLYANTPNPNARVQIMTIHKSKGLEFDHVILPYLEKKSANNTNQLLQWLEQPYAESEQHIDLLLAPIKHCSTSSDAIYDHVHRVEKIKLELENSRLFYVACTRAKRSLHLLAKLQSDDNNPDEFKSPAKNSQLFLLWGHYKNRFIENSLPYQASTVLPTPPGTLQRLISSQLNTDLYHCSEEKAGKPNLTALQLQTTPDLAPLIGTIIHAELQYIAATDVTQWNDDRLQQQQPRWQRQLRQALVSNSTLCDQATTTIYRALNNTLSHAKGQWLLSNDHTLAHSELAINHLDQANVIGSILDRCIIDNGITWVIDFKTGSPKDQSEEEFIHLQIKRYTPQLQRYQTAVADLYPYPVKCALFFPLCATPWVEINL